MNLKVPLEKKVRTAGHNWKVLLLFIKSYVFSIVEVLSRTGKISMDEDVEYMPVAQLFPEATKKEKAASKQKVGKAG